MGGYAVLRLVGLEEARGRTREEVGGKKCAGRKERGLKEVGGWVCGVEAGRLGGRRREEVCGKKQMEGQKKWVSVQFRRLLGWK